MYLLLVSVRYLLITERLHELIHCDWRHVKASSAMGGQKKKHLRLPRFREKYTSRVENAHDCHVRRIDGLGNRR